MELVTNLIDFKHRVWSLDVITNAFEVIDVERILHIPLAIGPHEDEEVWKGDASEEFFVKSTYKLLHRDNFSPNSDYVQHNSATFYKRLWNTHLWKTVQFLVWRTSLKFFPTMANLFTKRLTTSALCPRCRGEPVE